MKKLVLLCILQLSLTTNVFAHGDGKLGPNGGYINMPGAFHTELVPNDDGSFNVFLIDSNFKNPITKNSSVELKLLDNKTDIVFNCKATNETSFLCSSKEVSKKVMQGKVEVRAIRANVKAGVAKYSLPIKLKTEKKENSSEHDMNKM